MSDRWSLFDDLVMQAAADALAGMPLSARAGAALDLISQWLGQLQERVHSLVAEEWKGVAANSYRDARSDIASYVGFANVAVDPAQAANTKAQFSLAALSEAASQARHQALLTLGQAAA